MRPPEALALMISAALAIGCSSQSRNAKPVVAAQESANKAPAGSAVDPGLIKEGYRAVRRRGTILYCQTQSVTGTKFANTVCMTAGQIRELKSETEKSKRLLIRSGPANCVGSQCSN